MSSTILTANGNATVTATWNGISNFIETSLPSATTWAVTYNGVLSSSSSNTISFSIAPGKYSFTVPDQVINGVTYVPSPSSGTLNAGSNIKIAFTP